MPLETIGSLAMAGSSGATARTARTVNSDYSNAAGTGAFAAPAHRGGNSGGSVIQLPQPAANLSAYLSPFIRIDLQTRLAIVEIRNSETGEVQQQYPSPRVVREYQQNLPDESDLRNADPENGGNNTTGTTSGPVPGKKTEYLPVTSFDTVSGGAESASTPPKPVPSGFDGSQNSGTGGQELAVA